MVGRAVDSNVTILDTFPTVKCMKTTQGSVSLKQCLYAAMVVVVGGWGGGVRGGGRVPWQ